jgi:hypothetical protein
MDDSEYLRRPDAKGHLKVMEILRQWDPIGAIDESNQDEYDSYSDDIVRMLDAGVSVDVLVEHLRQLVDYMGLSGFDEDYSRHCAEQLVDFWKSWDGS